MEFADEGSGGGGGSAAWINLTNSSTTAAPILDIVQDVHVGLIATTTVVVGLLFLFVYFQLWAILYFRYKLLSYQTIFLFDVLLWASLRLSLYSFYYYNCCDLVDNLSSFVQWLMISAPEFLLYLALALVVHYFMEHLARFLERRQESGHVRCSLRKVRICRVVCNCVWLSSLLLFLVASVVFSILLECLSQHQTALRTSRVVILEGLIFSMGVALGVCIIIIYTTRAGKDLMEAKQISKHMAIFVSSLLIFLFCSRAIYNVTAVCLDNVAVGYDAVEFATDLDVTRSKLSHIVYFCVLLVWEVLPTFLIVVLFRVRIPMRVRQRMERSDSSTVAYDTKSYFDIKPDVGAEDPAGMVSFQRSSRMSIPSLPFYAARSSAPTVKEAGDRFGSTGNAKPHYSAPSKYSINNYHSFPQSYVPGTTPPRLFSGSPFVLTSDVSS